MKQRKFGKKVYNWHRPLKPSQLRRRFLRNRIESSSVAAHLASFEDSESEFIDPWSYTPGWDCCEACFNERRGFAHSEEIESFSLNALLEEIAYPDFWRLDLERAKDALFGAEGEDGESPLGRHSSKKAPVEERLAEHLERIKSYPKDSDELKGVLLASIGDQRALEMIRVVSSRIRNPNLAKLICIFAPFWARNPLSWNGEGGEFAFLAHVFALYEVPGFLYPCWMQVWHFHTDQFKWLLWFIIIGQGGSLKRGARLFGWNVSGKYQHYLGEAPDGSSLEGACLFAEVKRLGGDTRIFRLFYGLGFFNWDPTNPAEQSRDPQYSDFWRETLQWLLRHEGALDDDALWHCILEWAAHEYTESVRERRRRFSWKGRSPRSALERARQYHEQLYNAKSLEKWAGRDWDWQWTEEGVGNWTLIELTSSGDLFREGRAMSHCVAGYASRCVSGYSAIFSLRLNDSRRITVELNPRAKSIVQARGAFNRAANEDERRVLALWMKEKLESGSLDRV